MLYFINDFMFYFINCVKYCTSLKPIVYMIFKPPNKFGIVWHFVTSKLNNLCILLEIKGESYYYTLWITVVFNGLVPVLAIYIFKCKFVTFKTKENVKTSQSALQIFNFLFFIMYCECAVHVVWKSTCRRQEVIQCVFFTLIS